MTEDSWMRCEREYFVTTLEGKTKIPSKDLNKILLEYNKFLQKALLGESPFVAEDLKITILKGGKSDTERKDSRSGQSDEKGISLS
jgi:hypothetical protein